MSERRRRRGAANEMVTIFWRDIPAQVTASVNGEKGSWLLEERFQVAIDRAAGVAGLTDADDYVLEWRRVAVPFDGEPEAGARGEAERLQELYTRERVRSLVDAGGLDAESLTENS
ncbi:MAG: virulence factor [Actinomycetota bacterium]